MQVRVKGRVGPYKLIRKYVSTEIQEEMAVVRSVKTGREAVVFAKHLREYR